jgi:hypothetical protein
MPLERKQRGCGCAAREGGRGKWGDYLLLEGDPARLVPGIAPALAHRPRVARFSTNVADILAFVGAFTVALSAGVVMTAQLSSIIGGIGGGGGIVSCAIGGGEALDGARAAEGLRECAHRPRESTQLRPSLPRRHGCRGPRG